MRVALPTHPTREHRLQKVRGHITHSVVCGADGAESIVLLHGWGSSSAVWSGVSGFLAGSGYRVHALDFPGFGRSPEPPEPWSTYLYAEQLAGFIELNRAAPAILIGHSFGGRVAIVCASQHPELVSSLILVASAGVRTRRTERIHPWLLGVARPIRTLTSGVPVLGDALARFREWVYERIGSVDYLNASGVMRKTLSVVVNEDLRELARTIRIPTVLIWGDRDAETPLEQGRILHEAIPGSSLVILPGAGHYCFVDDFAGWSSAVRTFLGERDTSPS